jgi:hypothetical protein
MWIHQEKTYRTFRQARLCNNQEKMIKFVSSDLPFSLLILESISVFTIDFSTLYIDINEKN